MAKPIVDGLEKDLEGRASVARVSVLSSAGQELAGRYGVRSMPTFLIFDGDGELVGRHVGLPNRSRIRSMVAGIEPQ